MKRLFKGKAYRPYRLQYKQNAMDNKSPCLISQCIDWLLVCGTQGWDYS
ncbi:MAG: hypothetical protein LBJ00_08795 [Planctomycetaceae bacterium]|nr:hypothetical protein [Planctomycetaceae bacterium]